MDLEREFLKAVAAIGTTPVNGIFYRHVSWPYRNKALDGYVGGGRWSPPGTYKVIYLSQPEDSCVVEAYRWLVDPVLDGPPPPIQPRALVAAKVDATDVVDLRTATARMALDLTPDVLYSAAGDTDAYAVCRRIAIAAHQLSRHGIIAPAAGRSGLTLTLFADLLPRQERPQQVGDVQRWDQLPPDPRAPYRLHAVDVEPS